MNPSGSVRRPNSSASQRPVSSLSHHTNPYGSSASVVSLARPTSSASIRPTSRASYRPKSRQQKLTAAKLLPFCEDIVQREFSEPVDGDDELEIKYHELVDWSVKQLGLEGSNKASIILDMEGVEKMVRGHVEKARVKSQDTLATALEKTLNQLKEYAEEEGDLDDEIKKARLPAHIQFILALSSPPQPNTLTYAAQFLDALENPPPPAESEQLTWKKILQEDPYEGDHWVGVPGGIPLPRKRKSTFGDDDDLLDDLDDIDTSPSLSPLNSDDLALDDTDSDDDWRKPESKPPESLPSALSNNVATSYRPLYTTYAYRKELEDLKRKQYWKTDSTTHMDVQRRGTFDIGDASTLGPTLQRVLPKVTPTDSQLPLELVLSADRQIQEQDAVRDILIALQGRNNILFDKHFKTTPTTPRLLHLSLASQQSIFNVIGSSCRTIQRLRNFASAIMRYSTGVQSKPQTTTTITALDRMRSRAGVGKMTRTIEAFADAINTEIRTLEIWCAEREEAWLRALGGFSVHTNPSGTVVSLLGTEKAFRDRFEDSFQVLLDVVIRVVGSPQLRPERSDGSSEQSQSGSEDVITEEEWLRILPIRSRPPSSTTSLLLDTLFSTVQQRLERGDTATAEVLMRVFVKTAEPVWGMVGKWIMSGFGINNSGGDGNGGRVGAGLEEEFFIESNGLGVDLGVLGLLDPDFWKDGYSLRDGEDDEPSRRNCIPSFLQHVAGAVLEAGKARGLLKALGVDSSTVQGLSNLGTEDTNRAPWESFSDLVVGSSKPLHKSLSADDAQGHSLFSVSTDELSRLILDKLTPYARASGALLAQVIVEECDFYRHLRTIESLYLMRRGDIVSDFTDILFAKMDSKQNWIDFHFLNTALSDTVSASNGVSTPSEFIEVPLIRLSYRGARNVSLRTVRALDGLSLEYAIPFPLTYIFTPTMLQIYNEIWVFILQIRRAKSVLEKILVQRGQGTATGMGMGAGTKGNNPTLKALYAMRNRLSWFVNTFLNFITTYVIQVQTLAFHKEMTEAQSQSFDQMIKAHEEHLKQLQSRCLLTDKTTALHRAVLSILDMALNFSDIFSTFAGDVTMHDISNRSVVKLKHHRSRRQRRRRKNVIGFSHSMPIPPHESSSSSESDSDELAEGESKYEYSSYSVSLNASAFDSERGNDDMFTKISKMSTDLDGLVRFVRRGIETLAGGTSGAAATFGVLAFSLEDWDL